MSDSGRLKQTDFVVDDVLTPLDVCLQRRTD